MRPVRKEPVKVVFVIPPLVHLLDITGPAHIFYEAACYEAPVSLYFTNLQASDKSIISSSHLMLGGLVDYHTLDLHKGDLVFVPGLEASLLLNEEFLRGSSRPFQEWLTSQHRNGVMICSVCTGAYLLAEAGLLDNRPSTTHWKYLDRFARRYPETLVQHNRLFVHSEGIYTSAGVASGIDLSLFLLEELFGSRMAASIAKEVVVYMRRTETDPQLSAFLQYRNHLDDRIHKAQDILAQSLDKKVNIEQLAEQVHMSGRNLTRLFRKTTRISISQYVGKLRADRAQQLRKEGHTMQTIAASIGLKSTNQLRQLLKNS
ncbi:DJ-1/PfpI family protein [Paraflavitalea sp. CAU 1676]|uniref:GlxA family transcriptional regulator n=1 Tax=Paraflavitalea sp. CAU 1676 TaxID=3032598 RepID=UPI0023DB6882|nr:DJ-1/PfpI family protein [Paraflavitalea sp. CAU 1676]MDF2193580.1 DJ-1/PfpI family protein [Paraflavitalea sp. CAU 1676]